MSHYDEPGRVPFAAGSCGVGTSPLITPSQSWKKVELTVFDHAPAINAKYSIRTYTGAIKAAEQMTVLK